MSPVDNGYLKYNMTDIVWHNAAPAQPENNAARRKHLQTASRDDFIIKKIVLITFLIIFLYI